MTAIYIVLAAFCLLYLVLLLWFLIGWRKISEFKPEVNNCCTRFSIIIPARNEENNIQFILNDLLVQDYPKDFYEVIVVDDWSEDNTGEKVNQLINEITPCVPLVKLIRPDFDIKPGFTAFKKKAIETGIENSSGEFILTTDADCRVGSRWLRNIAAYLEEHPSYFISGPVSFLSEKTVFEKMQSLEFASLIGIGAASIANGSPNMCNGANMGFRKDIFYKVGGYSGIDSIASGDDEFLMHKIAVKYPGRVGFIKNIWSIVFTRANADLGTFYKQRKRWVSKSSKYQKKGIKPVLYLVYLFHLMILCCGIFSFFDLFFLHLFLISLVVKLLSELLFVVPVTKWLGKSRWLYLYPLAAVFYVIYVVVIGIAGNIGGYEWKGRKVG
jgi:cellulose synthase/poly-beta-1,6-N-acetylglucosamine synthase-like glycosyltransferase